MKSILRWALLAMACIAIGVGLAVLRAGIDKSAPSAIQLMRKGDAVLVLMPIVWIITTLMIGQAMPRRPKAATISAMVRKRRVVITPELRNAIVAAYIGERMPSIRDVARQVQCSYGTVHRVVTEAGVTRPRGLTRMAVRAQQARAAGA
jgi:transposase-like protein